MAKRKKYSLKKCILALLAIIFIALALTLFYIYGVLQPRNDRVWETGFEKLPEITIQGNTIKIHNVRNFGYVPDKLVSFGYLDRTIDLNKVEKVWFVVEPFGNRPGVAHTYFVFDIKGQDPLAVSIEARREKGEIYAATPGLLNQFELMYIWGTEKDVTVGRILAQHATVFMYPTTLSPQWTRQLFLQLAKDTHALQTTPRFYNTLTSNCTNELAKTANRVKPGAIPLNIALFLPAYAPEELYKLGFIPHEKSLEAMKKQYYISNLVKKLYKEKDFSQKLRQILKK